MIRQAFVLGAGLGTRLRPLTDQLPKPLVPIFQKPLITFAFDHLIDLGIERFVVNTHRLAENFAAVFPDATYRGRELVFVHETELLGTGGGIRNAAAHFGQEAFIVYSGDVLTDLALRPLLAEHARAGNDVTLALRQTPFPPSIAMHDQRVLDIGGKLGFPAEYDFANISIWNSEIIHRIPAQGSVSFVPTLVEAIRSGGKIGGVVANDGKWFNIGSPQQYLDVHRMIDSEGWRPNYTFADGDWPIAVAENASVDPTATLSGFHAVGPRAKVGPHALIEESVVWSGAQIAPGTRLRNCVVRSGETVQGELRDTVV